MAQGNGSGGRKKSGGGIILLGFAAVVLIAAGGGFFCIKYAMLPFSHLKNEISAAALSSIQPAAGEENPATADSDPLAWKPEAPSATPGNAPSLVPAVPVPASIPEPVAAPAAPVADIAPPALVAPPPETGIRAPSSTLTPAATPVEAAMPAPAAPDAGDKIQQLEKRLSDLEQELAGLKSAIAAKTETTAPAAVPQKDESALKTAQREVEDYKNGKMPETVKTPTAPKAKKPAVKKSSVRKAAPAVPAAPRWVLKAAKPGIAWVSEKGSGELRTVSVGDRLTGIGNVTSVSKDSSGRWVVNGSQGKINQ